MKHTPTKLHEYFLCEKINKKLTKIIYTTSDIVASINFNVLLFNNKGIVQQNTSKVDYIMFKKHVNGFDVGGISNNILTLQEIGVINIEWILKQMEMMKNDYINEKTENLIIYFSNIYSNIQTTKIPSTVFINNGHNYNDIEVYNKIMKSESVSEFLTKINVKSKNVVEIKFINIFDNNVSNLIINDIKKELKNNLKATSWRNCWLDYIAWSNGFKKGVKDVWKDFKINNHSIVLFSGLENIFNNVANSTSEQIAIEALLQDVPNFLNTRIEQNIGVLVFYKKEFVHYSIKQNAGQFLAMYSKFTI